MIKRINRRSFIKKSGAIGIASVFGTAIIPKLITGMQNPEGIDISIVQGTDYYKNTIEAINILGGIKKFVPKDSKVGLLINSSFDEPGAYVNPDVALAVVKLCYDACASEVRCLQSVSAEYWKKGTMAEKYNEEISSLKDTEVNKFPAVYSDEHFVKMEIPGAISLKEPEIIKELFNCDVFINIPISKHHFTTLFTGALKNMMGVCTRKTNVSFHLGSGVRNDTEYLGQCIADINLVRKADLCVVDATEFIVTNGPGGPGDILKPQKVVAGTDIVAIDSLCSSFLGYETDEIISTVKAYELGLGEKDYNKLKIMEITI